MKRKVLMFNQELSHYEDDGFAAQVNVEAENVDEIYVFRNGIMFPFEELSPVDQLKIKEQVIKHFFMEDASDDWESL